MVAFSTRARFRKHFQERKARLSPYTCILEIRTISFPLIHFREKSRAVKYSPSTRKTPFSTGIKKEGSSSIAIYLYTRNTNNFFSINPFSRKVSSSEIFAFDEEDPLFFWDKERGKLVYILVSIYLYPRNTNNFFSINPFSRKVSSSEIFPFDEEDPLFYWNKERKGGERNGCIEDEKFGGARFISAK